MNALLQVVQSPDILDNSKATHFTRDVQNIIKILHSPDNWDSHKVSQFTREVESIVEAGVKTILLDLKNVTFMSSGGLMTLVSILKTIRAANGKLLIRSANEQVRMLFEITGLDQVCEFVGR